MQTRTVFLFLILSSSLNAFAQTAEQKGNYFAVKPGEYFERVFKPWRYEYIPATNASGDSVTKIREVIFRRSVPVGNDNLQTGWKPDIKYEVFLAEDSTVLKPRAEQIRRSSPCTDANRGGDMLLVGRYLLLSTSSCVNCSANGTVDYCRGIIKRLFESVPDIDHTNWRDILKALPIKEEKFLLK